MCVINLITAKSSAAYSTESRALAQAYTTKLKAHGEAHTLALCQVYMFISAPHLQARSTYL
jgi:hypothetical protein